jgi:predicted nucleotidyltransferase
VGKISDGVVKLKAALDEYARRHHGRFLLYGSIARGDYRFNSDVDILVDFAENETDKAWQFAEQSCLDFGLIPDIRPVSFCEKKFLDKVSCEMVIIDGCKMA